MWNPNSCAIIEGLSAATTFSRTFKHLLSRVHLLLLLRLICIAIDKQHFQCTFELECRTACAKTRRTNIFTASCTRMVHVAMKVCLHWHLAFSLHLFALASAALSVLAPIITFRKCLGVHLVFITGIHIIRKQTPERIRERCSAILKRIQVGNVFVRC